MQLDDRENLATIEGRRQRFISFRMGNFCGKTQAAQNTNLDSDSFARYGCDEKAGNDVGRRCRRLPGLAAFRASVVPHPLAAPFAFEKANGLALFGIKKLIGKLKGGGAHRAVDVPISQLFLLIADHTAYHPACVKIKSGLSFQRSSTPTFRKREMTGPLPLRDK